MEQDALRVYALWNQSGTNEMESMRKTTVIEQFVVNNVE